MSKENDALFVDMMRQAKGNPDIARGLLNSAAAMLRHNRPMPDPLRLYIADRLKRIAHGDDCETILHLKRRAGDRSLHANTVEIRLLTVAALHVRYGMDVGKASKVCATLTETHPTTWSKLIEKHLAQVEKLASDMREGRLDPDEWLGPNLVEMTRKLYPNCEKACQAVSTT